MTTANSLQPPTSANGIAPVSPPVSPMDALAGQYDVDATPVPDKPAQTGAATPAAPSVAQQPAPSAPQAPNGGVSQHPAWLVDKATTLCGLHPLIIARLDRDELTQIVMDTIQNRLANTAQTSRMETVNNPNPPGQNPNAAAGVAAAAAQTPPAPPQEPAFDWGEHQAYDDLGQAIPGKKMAYTDDMINPAIGSKIKELAVGRKQDAERIKKLEDFIGTMQKQVVQNQERQYEREFDQAFSAIPDFFGNGSFAEVKDNAEYMTRRRHVFGMVKSMFASMPREAAGKMTIRDGVLSISKTMFGKEPKAGVAAAATPTPPGPNFTGAGLAQPTNRQPNPLPAGEARALSAVQAWWDQNKNGDGLPASGTTTMDEFM